MGDDQRRNRHRIFDFIGDEITILTTKRLVLRPWTDAESLDVIRNIVKILYIGDMNVFEEGTLGKDKLNAILKTAKDGCLFPYGQTSILKIPLTDYQWGNAENCEIAINRP